MLTGQWFLRVAAYTTCCCGGFVIESVKRVTRHSVFLPQALLFETHHPMREWGRSFFFFFTALPFSYEMEIRLCFAILRNLVSFASSFSTTGKHFACNIHVYVPFFICTRANLHVHALRIHVFLSGSFTLVLCEYGDVKNGCAKYWLLQIRSQSIIMYLQWDHTFLLSLPPICACACTYYVCHGCVCVCVCVYVRARARSLIKKCISKFCGIMLLSGEQQNK